MTALTDAERTQLAAWWNSEWPRDGSDAQDVLADVVAGIVAERVAAALEGAQDAQGAALTASEQASGPECHSDPAIEQRGGKCPTGIGCMRGVFTDHWKPCAECPQPEDEPTTRPITQPTTGGRDE